MPGWLDVTLTLAGITLVAFLFRACRGPRREAPPQDPHKLPEEMDGARRVPPPAIPEDVAGLIERLGDPDTRTDASDALVARGADVVPDLVSALADTEHVFRRSAVIEVLERIGDPRARAMLERLVVRGAYSCWADALTAAVSFGTHDAAQLALSAFDDGDHDGHWHPAVHDGYSGSEVDIRGLDPHAARLAVYQGIRSASERGRVTPEFRETLLVPVLRRVGSANIAARPSAADAVVALDRAVAAQVLQSADVLDRGPVAVTEVFVALVSEELPVDPAAAMECAGRLPLEVDGTGPEGAAAGAVLHALAASGHPGARARLEEFRKSPDTRMRDVARRAIARFEGVGDAAAFVLDRVAEAGQGGLTAPQRTYHLAWSYLNARSHGEWLAELADTDAADVEAALRAVSAGPAADLLAAARRRHATRRGLGKRADDPDAYADLDERSVEESWPALELLTEYAIAHAEHFRPQPPPLPPPLPPRPAA